MMSVSEYLSILSNIATVISLITAIFAIRFQIKSFTATRVRIYNNVAEWETATMNGTGEITEEIITVKCVNEGYVPTAIEGARFEIQFLDETDEWNVMDFILADKDTQLSMPIRIEAAGTARLKFVLKGKQSANARQNRLIYIQKILREKNEVRREVSLINKSFMFSDEKMAK